jgi:hypothetical protein
MNDIKISDNKTELLIKIHELLDYGEELPKLVDMNTSIYELKYTYLLMNLKFETRRKKDKENIIK